MNQLAMQALMQWNNPAFFESHQVYQKIHDLLCTLLVEKPGMSQLDNAQRALLTELVSGSIEATINAVNASWHLQEELLDTLSGLSELASELLPAESAKPVESKTLRTLGLPRLR